MFNKNNLVKYLILFFIVTTSTYYIPNCNIINKHAIYIGLIAGTTYILLDKYMPNIIIMNNQEKVNYNI